MKTAYLVGLVLLAVTLGFLGVEYGPAAVQSGGLRWGGLQYGTVFSVKINSGPGTESLSVSQPHNITIIIEVAPVDCYKVNSTIGYQVSSIDPSVGTQRIRLVDPPAGCYAVAPHP